MLEIHCKAIAEDVSKIRIRDKYFIPIKVELFRCLGLGAEIVEDLKRMLKEMGYSNGTIEEILRWYT